MLSRRRFMLAVVPVIGLGILAARAAYAQAKLAETDPMAVALGYKDDASKVDTKKFTTYKEGSVCSNCTLYQGKAADATAPCSAFGGKVVAGKGWRQAWVKKA